MNFRQIKSTSIDISDKTTSANKFSDGADNDLGSEKPSDYVASAPIVATSTNATPTETKCLKAAIDQFPSGFIPPESRIYGTIIFHIAICVYSFFGLAITCDNYFVTSLDRICEGNPMCRSMNALKRKYDEVLKKLLTIGFSLQV